jgi:hypothetical protein
MRLAVSCTGKKKYFLDLRIKSYGCLKFLGEVWARLACATGNEEELTNHKKIWGQGVAKMGDQWGRARRPDQRLLTIGRPSHGRPLISLGRL